MMKTDHIAVAVSDLDQAERVYRDVLQLDWEGREDVPGQKVLTSLFKAGETRLELIAPTSEDSPIAGFLNRRGPGLHHICFAVTDLDAEISRLKTAGIRLLNESPVPGAGGGSIVFIHPQSAAGVLIELVEKSR